MRRPFVVRVQNDDPALAREIARAIVGPLGERGARVKLDGVLQVTGPACGVHVLTASRGVPGTSVAVGVEDVEHGARWLAPIEVPDEPEAAAAHVLRFLEEWGFLQAPKRARAPI